VKLLLRLYNFLWYLAAPLVAILLLIKSKKLPAYRKRLAERFGFYRHKEAIDIWCHAVSVGEVVAASAVVEQALKHGLKVIVTTMTPTGSAQVLNLWGGKISHQYCPYDFYFAINNFLIDKQPKVLVVFETELWPGILSACFARNIPVILANARISNRSYKSYQRTAWFWKNLLAPMAKIYVQSARDEARFLSIGVANHQIEIAGNLKFAAKDVDKDLLNFWYKFKSCYPQQTIWVAGSTHPGEEEQILQVWQQLHAKYPDLMLIIAPRHPERLTQVKQLLQHNLAIRVQSLSSWQPELGLDVLLVDKMGVLSSAYAIANIAFVGGSLVPIGGHNILEPLRFGVPVVTGKYMHNQQDLMTIMQQDNLLSVAESIEDLSQTMLYLLRNPSDAFGEKAQLVLNKHQGSLEKHMRGIIKATQLP